MAHVTASTLGRHGFLRGLEEKDLARLAEVSTHIEFPSGHRMFDIGGTADRFWLLNNGLVVLDLVIPGQGHGDERRPSPAWPRSHRGRA